MCSSEGGNFSVVSFYFEFFVCIFQKKVVPLQPKRTRVATDKLAGKEAVAWDLRDKLKYKGTMYDVRRIN